MRATAEERYWLELKWRTTCRTILQLIVPLTHDVVTDTVTLGEAPPAAWRRFVELSARTLDRKRAACGTPRGVSAHPPRSVMFATAISMLGESEPMLQELRTARSRLAPGEVAVIWSCLRRGLLRMRYRLTGSSENRGKTWSRLDAISRRVHEQLVAKGLERPDDPRCSREHYEAVAAYVRATHPTDRNLPRTYAGVADLFEEFSAECEVMGDYLEAVDESDITLLPDLPRKEAYLNDCIARLTEDLADICAFIRGRTPAGEPTVEAYCAQTGLARGRYDRLKDRMVDQLGECVTRKLAPKLVLVA